MATTNAQASVEFLSAADDLLTRLMLDYSIFGEDKLNGRSTGKINKFARELRMSDKEVDDARALVKTERVALVLLLEHMLTLPLDAPNQLRKGKVTVDSALDTLSQFPSITAFYKKWGDDGEPLFNFHAKRYIMALRPDSGVAFHETDRYKNPSAAGAKKKKKAAPAAVAAAARRDAEMFIEVGVFATRSYKKGETILLHGGLADLTDAEDDALRGANGRSEFSVLWSKMKQCFSLLLGPARFVNHDCRNNVEFFLKNNRMTFKVVEDIAKDEELFTHYGDHYFDENNASCLCATCEQLGQGAFAPARPKKATQSQQPHATASPVGPSRRSARATAMINYDESDEAPPVASGSGHSVTAQRSLRTGLSRSSSTSALSSTTPASPRERRTPGSRTNPSRVSAIDLLRGQPRTVVQKKLIPPPGYQQDYWWDTRKHLAEYCGPTTCPADALAEKAKPKPKSQTTGMTRSASAPSGFKRRRSASDSPAPSASQGKGKARESADSPAPKRARPSLVQNLKTARLGERSSKRIAGGSASARDRAFAKLSQAMGGEEGAEESDLSELEESEIAEDDAKMLVEESELTDFEDSEEESKQVAALLSPASASPANTSHHRAAKSETPMPFAMPGLSTSAPLSRAPSPAPTATTSANVTTVVSHPTRSTRSTRSSLPASDLSVVASRAFAVEATSTPVEESLSPSLRCEFSAEAEDRNNSGAVPGQEESETLTRRNPRRSIAPSSFFTAAASDADAGGNGASSSATGQDFRVAPSSEGGGKTNVPRTGLGGGIGRGGRGGRGGIGGGGGGGGGDDERDGERRRILPVDQMDIEGVQEEEEEKPDLADQTDSGKGVEAPATAEEQVAVDPQEDVAAALLMLLSAPLSTSSARTASSIAPTPPQADSSTASTSTEGSTSTSDLTTASRKGKRKRVSDAHQPTPAPSSLNPRSTRRQPKLDSPAPLASTEPSPEPASAIASSSSTTAKPRAKKARVSDSPAPALELAASTSSKREDVISRSSAANEARPGSASPAVEARRTRSQPLPGKLEDVLYAPETLAAMGGFDHEKGRYISKHEALRSPSSNPRRPPPSPSPPPPTVAGPSRLSKPEPAQPKSSISASNAKKYRASQSPAPPLPKPAPSSRPSTSSSRAPVPPTASSSRRNSLSAPPAAIAPASGRSTRKSFPMANMKLADIVYGETARGASGGWDPVLERYVSAATAVKLAEEREADAPAATPAPIRSSSAFPATSVAFAKKRASSGTSTTSASTSSASAPPESGRSTRRSCPMADKSLADLVYNSAIGGWDEKAGKYVSAATAAKAAGEGPGRTPAGSSRKRRSSSFAGSSAARSAPKERVASASPAPVAAVGNSASPAPPPEGKRSTRRSFPMAGLKMEDLVYSEQARGATGGWDPVRERYVSAATAAKLAGARGR
ncbi:hypothetical protein JCM10213_000464 [Rhodosporidiobolus nylandii]